MNLSDVTMEDVVAIGRLVVLLQKSTFSLNLDEAAGAGQATAWFQRFREVATTTYQTQLAKADDKPKDGGFKIKDYQPSPGSPKVGKK